MARSLINDNDMDVKIIDTHIHVWDLDKARYEWLDGDSSILNRSYALEELLPSMHEAGVCGGILVQAANNEEDTQLMLAAAQEHPEIKGIVGWLPLADPRATIAQLEQRYVNEPLFRGVRHLIHNESDPRWLLQDTVLESLAILAAYNIPYDVVGVSDAHLSTTAEVVEKIPELRVVLDHLNQPPIASGKISGKWNDLMREIARHPNVYVKLSGLGTASGNFSGWQKKDIQPYVEFVLKHFGAERCFCGGDWPVSLLAGSYQKHWQIYREMLEELLEPSALEQVFYENASVFYNLGK